MIATIEDISPKFETDGLKNKSQTEIYQYSSLIDRPKKIVEISMLLNDLNLGMIIENSIFEYAVIYCESQVITLDYFESIYENKYINIYKNMDVKSDVKNVKLISKVKSDLSFASKIGLLSQQQLFPDNWTLIQEKDQQLKKNNKDIFDFITKN